MKLNAPNKIHLVSISTTWIGFETNLQYRQDIRNRIREGMLIYAESQTQNLGEY